MVPEGPRFLQSADEVEDVDDIWNVMYLCLLRVRGLTAVSSGRCCCLSRVTGIGILDGAMRLIRARLRYKDVVVVGRKGGWIDENQFTNSNN